jgi:hypothetical protein
MINTVATNDVTETAAVAPVLWGSATVAPSFA